MNYLPSPCHHSVLFLSFSFSPSLTSFFLLDLQISTTLISYFYAILALCCSKIQIPSFSVRVPFWDHYDNVEEREAGWGDVVESMPWYKKERERGSADISVSSLGFPYSASISSAFFSIHTPSLSFLFSFFLQVIKQHLTCNSGLKMFLSEIYIPGMESVKNINSNSDKFY